MQTDHNDKNDGGRRNPRRDSVWSALAKQAHRANFLAIDARSHEADSWPNPGCVPASRGRRRVKRFESLPAGILLPGAAAHAGG